MFCDDFTGELVHRPDVDPAYECVTTEPVQALPQVGGEVRVVRGQQHGPGLSRWEPVDEVPDPVERHDGLAGARPARDLRRSLERCGGESVLLGMEEEPPGFETVPERVQDRRVLRTHLGDGASCRSGPVLRIDSFLGPPLVGDERAYLGRLHAVVQRQQHLPGESGKVVTEHGLQLAAVGDPSQGGQQGTPWTGTGPF